MSILPGIGQISIDWKTGRGSLQADTGLTSPEQILAAIKKAGYEAQIAGNTSNKQMVFESRQPVRITIEFSPEIKAPIQPIEVEKPNTSNDKTSKKISLALSGMHCSSCAGIIDRIL